MHSHCQRVSMLTPGEQLGIVWTTLNEARGGGGGESNCEGTVYVPQFSPDIVDKSLLKSHLI